MLTDTLTQLYLRDLHKLGEELKKYSSEDKMWVTSGQVNNCAGNLALHCVGNLQHFIGAVLGKTGYVRNRPAEFESKNVPLKEILEEIDITKGALESTLQRLDEKDLEATYPLEVMGHSMTTEFFLVHLLSHLDYHIGQISYHRRLVDH